MKIDLVGCEYKIFVIMLNMENELETYSMFLGRPWFKPSKANHNWGDNTLSIIVGKRTMTICTIKKIILKP